MQRNREERGSELLARQFHVLHRQTDRLFAWLMALQILAGIGAALYISPRTWIGDASRTHIHVWASIFLGTAIGSLPIAMAIRYPGVWLTRHSIAAAQMLMSALLIHVTGGRIETHFHVFGSLAFLAFYRDWRVLLTGTIVIAVDHFLRGIYWPQSVFGVLAAGQWRWLEHVGWVAFENVILLWSIKINIREMHQLAHRQAELEGMNSRFEDEVRQRTDSMRKSEAKLRSFLSSLPGIAYRFHWSDDATVEFAGGNIRALTGLEVGDFIGKNAHEIMARFVHPDDGDAMTQFSESLRHNGRWAGEYRIVDSEKNVRWIRDEARTVAIDGITTYVDGIILDVTDRREAEQELRKNQQLLKGLLDTTDAVIYVKDVEGRYLMVNRKWSEVVGLTPEDALGRNDAELMPPGIAESFAANDRRARETRSVVTVEETPDVGGEQRTFISNKFPILDESGNALAVAGVSTDVTKLKRIQAELEHARSAAERANRAKSEFLSNMSHELRTPLNGVLGYTQILLGDGNIDDDQRHSLDAIQNCGQHLLMLINDVLDLSKIEAGKLEIETRPCDFHRLIMSVQDVVAQRAADKSLALSIDVAPEVPRGLVTDATKLRQVLVNLVGNAVKFTESGRVELRIQETPEERIRFEVADTGPGISAEEIEGIFEPFSQATAGRHSGGTGLGLAICRRIVHAMGGTLTVESEPGKGSVFAFEVPLVETGDFEGIGVDDTDNLIDQRIPTLGNERKWSVLIADDREENRDILHRLLRAAGFQTVIVENGAEALTTMRTTPVDLVLMDVRMPVLSGLDATRQAKKDPGLANIPIIAVTASVFPDQQERFLEAGFDEFLGKPVRIADLFYKIGRLLQIEWVNQDSPETEAQPIRSEKMPANEAAAFAMRIRQLADIGDFAALESCASDLRARADEGSNAGRELQDYVREFDVAGALKLADRLGGEGE